METASSMVPGPQRNADTPSKVFAWCTLLFFISMVAAASSGVYALAPWLLVVFLPLWSAVYASWHKITIVERWVDGTVVDARVRGGSRGLVNISFESTRYLVYKNNYREGHGLQWVSVKYLVDDRGLLKLGPVGRDKDERANARDCFCACSLLLVAAIFGFWVICLDMLLRGAWEAMSWRRQRIVSLVMIFVWCAAFLGKAIVLASSTDLQARFDACGWPLYEPDAQLFAKAHLRLVDSSSVPVADAVLALPCDDDLELP